jgi:hypothetical protein
MSMLPKLWHENIKGGTEEFWVPAVIAGLSAAATGVNQMQATKRANNAETQAIANQNQIRGEATGQVKALTDQIAKSNPQQLAAKQTGDFVNTLRSAAASKTAPTSALDPAAAGANSRYNSDVARSQGDVQTYGNTQANETSAIDSAVRQRQNESLAQQTLGAGLNGLGIQSQAQSFVDQLRAKQAGQSNPWVNLAAGMVGGGAKAYAQNPDMFGKNNGNLNAGNVNGWVS